MMVELRGVRFAYPSGEFTIDVPALDVASGEAIAIVGPSGCGKTTLLELIGGILAPQQGAIRVSGVEVSASAAAARARFRINHVGFVFQGIELVDYLSVRDNILLPYRIHRSLRLTPAARERAVRIAAEVGLEGKLHRYPHQLSQGERQRAAMCRALVTEPPLVLADEPTSSLDAAASGRTLDCLIGLVRTRGTTLVMATHNPALLDRFDRVVDSARFSGGLP